MERHLLAAILVHDERVLLCRRTGAPPGEWDFPSGPRRPDVPDDEALAAALFDRLGISATVHGPRPHFSLTAAGTGVDVWVVRLWEGTPHNLCPEEYGEIRWFSLAEARDLRLPAERYRTWLADELSFSG